MIATVCGGAVATEPVPPPAAVRPVDAAARERLREAVTWLASADREGRGPGTAGIDAAADWVARQFATLGLDTTVIGDEPFQPFAMTLEATLGPAADNSVEIVGPPDVSGSPLRIPLVLGEDFTPLAAGGSGAFDLPLLFGGFGITAPKEGYDDYASLPDRGKGGAIIVLRQEPQKDDPHSVFDGNQASQHASLARKVANASEHEAGGVVFCNDVAEGDGLMSFTRAGEGSEKRTLPILHLKRHVIDG
ncbi:MAG: hypothetical protein ACKOOF_03185, partial [Planctomycetaceae bacterium]